MSSSQWTVQKPVQVLISKYPDLEADVIEQVFLNNRCHMEATELYLRKEMGAVSKEMCIRMPDAHRSDNSTQFDNYSPLIVTNKSGTTSQNSVQGRKMQTPAESDDDVIEISTDRQEVRPLSRETEYETEWFGADTLRFQWFNFHSTLLSYYDLHKPSQNTQTLAVKRLILLRGLPGSGKSTRAKAIVQKDGGAIFSADQYFLDNDGNYRYQKELIGRAHLWNRTRAQNAASQGVSPIIIDNTNTMMREMKPYIGIARHFGYIVELEEMKTPWSTNFRELARRNIHGVDETSIRLMRSRYEKINKNDVMTVFCRMPSPNKFKTSVANEERPVNALLPVTPSVDTVPRTNRSSPIESDQNRPTTTNSSERSLTVCPPVVPPVVVPKPTRLKQASSSTQPRVAADTKVQDWMTAQLSNLSVTAAEFRPTASTFIPKTTCQSERQQDPPNEDERTLLSIFPRQSLENVRNLLIGNNGNMDACIEVLCDLADNELPSNSPPENTAKNVAIPADCVASSSFLHSSPKTGHAITAVPSLKSLALKVVDQSLTDNVMDRDALVIINSSMSLHEKSLMNSLGPNVKVEDLDEEQSYIDILDSDDSEDDETSNDITVIQNSTLIATDPDTAGTRSNLSSTLKPPTNEIPSFDCPLPPELTSQLISLFGTFPDWDKKRSVSMDQSLLKAIYEAWKDTPVLQDEQDRRFLQGSVFSQQPNPSIIDLTSPVKAPAASAANEFTLIDISASSFGSPAASDKSSGTSPKAKRQKRTKGPRVDLASQLVSSKGSEVSGSRGGVSLCQIMDEEERAERSENAQKYAFSMANAIDTGLAQTSKDTMAHILKTTAQTNPYWDDADLQQSTSSYQPQPVLGAVVDPDRSFQTLVRPDYVDYRAESNMYRDLRQRELEKAMHATGPDKAAKREHYARNAFEYGELMKEANQRAALLTLERNKEARGGALDELDLHKLHVEEALVAVKNHLAELTHPNQRGRYNKLRIITGWGKNTLGPARIKPEVIKLLRKEKLNFKLENIGSILVYLK